MALGGDEVDDDDDPDMSSVVGYPILSPLLSLHLSLPELHGHLVCIPPTVAREGNTEAER